ncbi:GntR family transcriptional regulator [Planosporangium sp. 12N6]|uniref:GntR family transcriptional regulator n=1 Tax=Planosporangium spinosum TaxID=3402278 RepID=UPI003CEEC504
MPAVPLYENIRADLRRRISAGEWAPGVQIPTQQELAAHYGTSLQPVKTALWMLELDGVVIRRQGKGVFVADRTADSDA